MSSEEKNDMEIIKQKKENEEKYRNIIHNLSDVIIEIDSEGKYTLVNPKYFDLFGYKPEEVVGQRAFNLIHPDDVPKISELMKKTVETGEVQTIRCRTRHKKGYYIPIFARGSIFLEKGKLKIVAIVRKASNEQKLETQLQYLEELLSDLERQLKEKTINFKESEKKFRHLFETSPYPIIVLDFKGVIREINPATVKLFKYDIDDLIGKNFQKLVIFPPESLEILQKAFKDITQGQKFGPVEIPSYDKDGNIVWIHATATLVKLYNEILIQVIIQDITEQKFAKEGLVA